MAKSIKSTFKTDADGWTLQGDAAAAGWVADGGNGGGYFGWTDAAAGANSFYIAPAKFLGDKHGFYGGSFSYDIFDTGYTPADIEDATIVGANGVTLVARLGVPGTDWTHFETTLDVNGGWHVGTLSGAVATRADIKGVLRDIDQVILKAEYVNGAESGGLDNVRMDKPLAQVGPDAFAPADHAVAVGGTSFLPHGDHLGVHVALA